MSHMIHSVGDLNGLAEVCLGGVCVVSERQRGIFDPTAVGFGEATCLIFHGASQPREASDEENYE
jgi:hypothetical protein